MKRIHLRAIVLAVALNLSGILLAVGLAYSVYARADDMSSENMSKEQYESLENNLRAEYRLTKVQCHSLSLFPSYLCILKARHKKDVAIAELDADYKLSVKAQHDARVAKTAADLEACEDLNVMCRNEAKISLTSNGLD